MANAAFKLLRGFIRTQYATYMSVSGILFAVANYDTYHTNKLTHDLAEKYNPNGSTYITIKNMFMCPVARCDIYSVNKEAVGREFIASETKVIIPPIIKVWTDEFYVNGENK
jgi:hypothetical protein